MLGYKLIKKSKLEGMEKDIKNLRVSFESCKVLREYRNYYYTRRGEHIYILSPNFRLEEVVDNLVFKIEYIFSNQTNINVDYNFDPKKVEKYIDSMIENKEFKAKMDKYCKAKCKNKKAKE